MALGALRSGRRAAHCPLREGPAGSISAGQAATRYALSRRPPGAQETSRGRGLGRGEASGGRGPGRGRDPVGSGREGQGAEPEVGRRGGPGGRASVGRGWEAGRGRGDGRELKTGPESRAGLEREEARRTGEGRVVSRTRGGRGTRKGLRGAAAGAGASGAEAVARAGPGRADCAPECVGGSGLGSLLTRWAGSAGAICLCREPADECLEPRLCVVVAWSSGRGRPGRSSGPGPEGSGTGRRGAGSLLGVPGSPESPNAVLPAVCPTSEGGSPASRSIPQLCGRRAGPGRERFRLLRAPSFRAGETGTERVAACQPPAPPRSGPAPGRGTEN